MLVNRSSLLSEQETAFGGRPAPHPHAGIRSVGLGEAVARPDGAVTAPLAPPTGLDLAKLPKHGLLAIEVVLATIAGTVAAALVNLHPARFVVIAAMGVALGRVDEL